MKAKNLGMALAFVAAAPAIVAPQLVATANAQPAMATADYPDVPKNHWAYDAINKLSQAGIIEGRPGGTYNGNQAMTRYEFAVAIARLLTKIGGPGVVGLQGIQGVPGATGPAGRDGVGGVGGPTLAEINDLIAALRREFQQDLANMGVRVDAVEARVSDLENRTPVAPRVTVSPSILHRTGAATYIGSTTNGRGIVVGNAGAPSTSGTNFVPNNSVFRNSQFVDGKFSYTDFELRLTDRVTDRLSVNAALRSLGGTQEDPWAGENINIGSFGGAGGGNIGNGADVNLREAYAVANLGERSFLGLKGLNAILGRQRTKIAQGLLYDNDLSPTDQLHSQFNVGPLAFTAILGTTNNNTTFGRQPYFSQGAGRYLGVANGVGAVLGQRNSSAVGFSNGTGIGFNGGGAGTGVNTFTGANVPDDNESLLRAGVNLFKVAGNPIQLGITRQFDGVAFSSGDSLDLTVPLFNRTIGVEYVRQRQFADGTSPTAGGGNKAVAYNVTIPVLRARVLDLNFAYGKARDNFEYMLSSAANPFARTYGEAIFDRPLALGAPLVAGNIAGVPKYMAAKQVYDFNGTLRVLRRLPLDFRYYNANGTGGINLGDVYSVGSNFNISPGLDLEVKYGYYNPSNNAAGDVKYIRFGANVGF